MQVDMGGPAAGGAIPAHYAYVARYAYSDVVAQNDNVLLLCPYDAGHRTPGYGGGEVETIPAGRKATYRDRLGNVVNRIRIASPHRELIIAATGQAWLSGGAPEVEDASLDALAYGVEAQEFLTASHLVDPESVREAAWETAGDAETLLETVERVVSWIHDNIRYRRGDTSVNTKAADVLAAMSGVCQDMTHLGLAMLRVRGVPARYASGLLTRQPGETHAWLEYLHPEQGWLPADPTRGMAAPEGADYLKFAVGRDYSEAKPVSGSFVSSGKGWLSFTTAEVYFDRESVSLEDALALLDG